MLFNNQFLLGKNLINNMYNNYRFIFLNYNNNSKMFGWFGTTPEEEEARRLDIKNMFYYTNRKNNYRVNEIIHKHENSRAFDLNSRECRDEYDNSLLHVAVSSKNYELTKQLILLGLNKLHKNTFSETPNDIAIKNHDIQMIKILENLECDEYLLARIDNLETVNVKLNDDVLELTTKNVLLSEDLASTKRSLKRQRDECTTHIKSIKKLKSDNDKLKKDNTDLQNTVNTLRDSFKK